MKIGILGAGISGLSISKLLQKHFDVEVLEKTSLCGGIARTKTVDEITYHVTGGHCFNSKNKEVLAFVFNEILPEAEWNKINRKAKIDFKGSEIDYPIEFSINQIAIENPTLAQKIIDDYLAINNKLANDNLLDWFKNNFGETLTEVYFKPYNEKVWKCDLAQMTPEWVMDKLPIPDKDSFKQSLKHRQEDKMPHHSFYYPKSNNQNTFIEALAQGTNISFDYEVSDIKYDHTAKKWIINNEKQYDLIINTLPLNLLPNWLNHSPAVVLEAAAKLKCNAVSTMLWETMPTSNTWTYQPSTDKLAHRYIHIGNFFKPAKNYTIIEAIGNYSFDEMEKSEKNNPFFKKALAHHTAKYAYVVFDKNYASAREIILNYLQKVELYTVGRFGEWQYYNMDICIEKCMALAKQIVAKYK